MTPPLGAYFVVRTNGFAGAVIRLATRSRENHAGVHVGGGMVVEAQPHGARLSPLTDYSGPIGWNDEEPLTDAQRQAIADAARGLVGRPYSWLDILALGLRQFGVRLPGLAKRIERSDRLICSQLVDLAYEVAGVHLFTDGRLPQDVTPGDLADRLVCESWAAEAAPVHPDQ